MDFEEAFNSGKKFRLPKDCMGEGSWPDEFYWYKLSENEVLVIVGKADKQFNFPISDLDKINDDYADTNSDLVIYRLSDDWETIE